jgi:hypothetical protein
MRTATSYRRSIWNIFQVPRDGAHRLLYDIWQPLALLVLAISFTIIVFATEPGAANDVVFYCNADGKIKKRGDRSYKPLWDPEQFFTINVAYGSMPFSVAKFIDACWDITVGRGGQMLVAIVAYRVLRRSLTLIMETCAVPVSMATTIYCRQIQLASVWETLCCSLSSKKRYPQAGMELSLKLRLIAHLFVCAYVLSFATLASVTTGYRAGLTGYFDFKADESSQLKPVTKISHPLVSLYDGNRIGLSDQAIHLTSSPVLAGEVDLGAFLNKSSSSMDDLTGALFDCKRYVSLSYWILLLTCLLADYYTCRGLLDDKQNKNGTRPRGATITFTCANHDCSCSLSRGYDPDDSPAAQTAVMTSSIALNGKQWDLPAPPLSISLVAIGHILKNQSSQDTTAGYYWSGHSIDDNSLEHRAYINGSESTVLTMYDNTLDIDLDSVIDTGACIANDAYQWGFSSLVLLSFCSYTLLFVATLIGLQIDVFRNSRSDRDPESHSIYHDILFLAAELETLFGEHVGDFSAKEIEHEIAHCETGLDLDVEKLLIARARDWNLSLEGKAAREKFIVSRRGLEDAIQWLADQGLSFEPLEPLDLETLEGKFKRRARLER